jgi:hypothetical protein
VRRESIRDQKAGEAIADDHDIEAVRHLALAQPNAPQRRVIGIGLQIT